MNEEHVREIARDFLFPHQDDVFRYACRRCGYYHANACIDHRYWVLTSFDPILVWAELHKMKARAELEDERYVAYRRDIDVLHRNNPWLRWQWPAWKDLVHTWEIDWDLIRTYSGVTMRDSYPPAWP